MTEKRFEVFVSSNTEDLSGERAAVVHSLMLSNFFVSIIDYFNQNPLDKSRLAERLIEGCDYYILILGGLYGPLHPSGFGFIEREFDYAVIRRKPIWAFVHANPHELPDEKKEKSPERIGKYDTFLKKINGGSSVSTWTSAEDLSNKVVLSSIRMTKLTPGVGWIRSTALDDIAREQKKLNAEKESLLRKLNAYSQPQARYTRRLKEHVKIKYWWKWHEYHHGSASFSLGEIMRAVLTSFGSATSYYSAKQSINKVLSSMIHKKISYYEAFAVEEESVAKIWTSLRTNEFIRPSEEGSDYYVAEERAYIAVKRWSERPRLFG